ncbi:hypothetical protein GCM10011494_15700 [Novosphingobium endophyticum]|uniref:Copper chaperone PCu(A)C n=1 Tax=Novosphingobium endophyticum TaxID=1955250 RepID=A0A916X490_9SPHN|nr:copper chaperone PCu(A)C [Novosphingobium endophyticum]GGB98093.1 hypothetical protein GCM10011494_15700 [Novosphingobium endophyticum]
MKIFRALTLSSAALAAVSLAACQQAEPPVEQEAGVAQTGPDAKPGFSATGGRLVLPAVAERPSAVYFTVRNDGSAAATLVGVHVDGAGEAEMHKTEGGSMSPVDQLEIAPGTAIEFAPGGLHVMAFGLSRELTAGGNSEATLTFSDGDKISIPLQVEAMGAGTSDGHMPGMDH